MKSKKINLGRLFYNNKFILLFSLILAFFAWVAVSMSSNGPETTSTITNIPIKIELNQAAKDEGLEVYYPNGEKTASVTVKGNSLTLSKIKANDLTVIAPQSDTIVEGGTYDLSLIAKGTSNITGYTIDQDSLSIKNIRILVDVKTSANFEVKSNINYSVDPGYFSSGASFNPSTISVIGPENIVSKIANLQVDYNIPKALVASKSFVAPVSIYDTNGNAITDAERSLLNISNTDVKVDMQVLKKATLPLKATFLNQPANFDYNSMVILEDNDIDIACDEAGLKDMQFISLDPIDFANVNEQNLEFNQRVNLPENCKNLSNQYNIKVKLNLGDIASKTINITNFNVKNVPENTTANVVTKDLNITVVGPQDQIDKITPENIYAEIDLSTKSDFRGSIEMPLDLKINNFDDFWINGSYKVNVSIKDK